MTIDPALPGAEVVSEGLADLAKRRETPASLLVMIGAERLRRLGIDVPAPIVSDPEKSLYRHLAASGEDSAHSRYNSLLRLLVSFERAAECGVR